LRVGEKVDVGGAVEDRPELVEGVAQLVFLVFAFGHVAEVHRKSFFGGVGGHRQPGVEGRVKLLQVHNLLLLHGPVGFRVEPQAGRVGVQVPQVLPYQFAAPGVEKRFEGPVGLHDPPVAVHHKKAIRDRIQDGVHSVRSLRVFDFGRYPFRDVVADAQDFGDVAGRVGNPRKLPGRPVKLPRRAALANGEFNGLPRPGDAPMAAWLQVSTSPG
jgi:hypothetical protein